MEFTVYSPGDSNDINTWSNVPYMFCRALEHKGVKVNRVDIGSFYRLGIIIDKILYGIFNRILKTKRRPYYRMTLLHKTIVEKILKRAAKQYPSTDLNLFFGYDYVNRYSDVPNAQWCDWTERMAIERKGRKPSIYEKHYLKREDQAITKADIVYSMFPHCKKQMEKIYKREIRHLGINVINTTNTKVSVGDNHYNSNKILFIGKAVSYQKGVLALINSVEKLLTKYPDIEVEIIGMTADELKIEEKAWIHFHGFLNKSKPNESEKYYKLMSEARIFINPTPGWGGYSSTIEAMYYGCPVIVTPYDDFVEEMGTEISFGRYTNGSDLADKIDEVLSLPEKDYMKMSEEAHKRVKDYTWDNYVDLFLADLNNAGIIKWDENKR